MRQALTQSRLICRMGADATYMSAIELGKKTAHGEALLDALVVALDLSTHEAMALRHAAALSLRT